MQRKVGCYDALAGSVLFILQTLCLITAKVKAVLVFTAPIGSKLRDVAGTFCSASLRLQSKSYFYLG
jgi:hypothetical protein